MKTVDEMWAELEREFCVAGRSASRHLLHVIRDKNGDALAATETPRLAIWCAYATLRPDSDEAKALHAAVAAMDQPQPPVEATPATDDESLSSRLLSLVRDGYWMVPVGAGQCGWSTSVDQGHICPDLPTAIAEAEAHRRERQQPKPVWYCLVPGRGEPRVPHKTESDAVTEAARLANRERRPVQVLGVVQVVQPDQT